MTSETTHDTLIGSTFPLRRPETLVACARIGARRYRRIRDLPGAVPGLLAGEPEAILPRLVSEENRCEQARRDGSAAYRPAQHVQILSALLAEAAACQASSAAAGQKTRTVTAPPRRAAPGQRPASAFPHKTLEVTGFLRQANASGSEALRRAT